MPTIDEAAGNPPTQLWGPLLAGIGDITQQQRVVFTTYARKVLPLDGFVFWLRTGQFDHAGTLHHQASRSQNEDDTVTIDAVLFTSPEQIVALNATNDSLVVGEVEGVRYAFGTHSWVSAQAGLWHYGGASVPATLATQLIDDPGQLDPARLIVSDSLPAWLAITAYAPPWLIPANPAIPLYPSFLVPDNIAPPFGAVHIEPAGIRALQSAPLLLNTVVPVLNNLGQPVLDTHGVAVTKTETRHTQLVAERVRVTLYGTDNPTALAFLDTVLRYSLDTGIIGLLNMPAVRDGKRGWMEGMLIGQQKQIDFEISYIQTALYDLALELIQLAATAVIQPPGC